MNSILNKIETFSVHRLDRCTKHVSSSTYWTSPVGNYRERVNHSPHNTTMQTFYYKQASIPKKGLDVIVEIKGEQPVDFTFGSKQHPDPEIHSKRPSHLITSGLFDESILFIKRITC